MRYKKRKKRTFQYKSKTQKNKKETTAFRNLLKVISKCSKPVHFFIAIFALVLGIIFNALDEMPLFWIKGFLGFVLYLILSYTILYTAKQNNKIMFELTGDPKLSKCREDYTKRINSNFNFILCFIACVYFVTISIVLGFVEINPIGVYSLFALSCVVFVAFIIFQQYIWVLLLLHDISKISPQKFYELIPEKTAWFDLLERFSNICRNLFVVLGSLFIMLFMVFAPVNSIQIIFQEKLSSPRFIPLLCTWIIILIAIIFMIPFSSFIRSNLLQKIYKNLICQSITNYNQMYKETKSDIKVVYIDIILRLNDRKYILQNSYTWVIPVLVSIVNFTSIIISIIVDVKELQLFA